MPSTRLISYVSIRISEIVLICHIYRSAECRDTVNSIIGLCKKQAYHSMRQAHPSRTRSPRVCVSKFVESLRWCRYQIQWCVSTLYWHPEDERRTVYRRMMVAQLDLGPNCLLYVCSVQSHSRRHCWPAHTPATSWHYVINNLSFVADGWDVRHVSRIPNTPPSPGFNFIP